VPRAINALFNRLLLSASLFERHTIGPADLEETVLEMREEFGPLQRGEAERVEPPEPTPAIVGSGVAAGRQPTAAGLTARLDRIDREVATALALLRQLGHPGAAPAPAPVEARRPRFGGRPPRPAG
jgi:hypothetical protein